MTVAQVHITEKTLACLEEEEKETYQPRLVDHMTDEVAGGVVDLLGGSGEWYGYLPDSKQDGWAVGKRRSGAKNKKTRS